MSTETVVNKIPGTLDLSAALSGQIIFPSTQNPSSNANTLDDYKEGTFEPTLTCGTSGTITAGVKNGYYVKIGKNVFAWGIIDVSFTSSPLGILYLNLIGLPAAAGYSAATIRGSGMLMLNGNLQGSVDGSGGQSRIIIERFYQGAMVSDVSQYVETGGVCYICFSCMYVAAN